MPAPGCERKSAQGTNHIEISHAASCSFSQNQMMHLPYLLATHLFTALTVNSLRFETLDGLKFH